MPAAILRTEGLDSGGGKTSELSKPMAGRGRWVAMACVTLLALTAYLPLLASTNETPARKAVFSELLVEPPREILSRLSGAVAYRYAESTRDGNDPRLGMNSDQWDLRLDDVVGRLVFSQPYDEWHDLTICYKSLGWQLEDVTLLSPETSQSREKVQLARMVRKDGTIGYLFFAGLTDEGTVLEPPHESFLRKTFERCRQLVTGGLVDDSAYQPCAMLQAWVVNETELGPETIAKLCDSVALARDEFAKLLKGEATRKQ
jgi:hypothetical protein